MTNAHLMQHVRVPLPEADPYRVVPLIQQAAAKLLIVRRDVGGRRLLDPEHGRVESRARAWWILYVVLISIIIIIRHRHNTIHNTTIQYIIRIIHNTNGNPVYCHTLGTPHHAR